MVDLQVRPNPEAPNYFHLSGSLVHQTCLQFIHEVNKGINPFVDSVTLNTLCLNRLDGSGVGVLVTLAICLHHQRKRLILVTPKDRQPYQLLQFLKLTTFIGA